MNPKRARAFGATFIRYPRFPKYVFIFSISWGVVGDEGEINPIVSPGCSLLGVRIRLVL
jgi:hypothetical protein